jgi:hypothetical protein
MASSGGKHIARISELTAQAYDQARKEGLSETEATLFARSLWDLYTSKPAMLQEHERLARAVQPLEPFAGPLPPELALLGQSDTDRYAESMRRKLEKLMKQMTEDESF